MSGKDYLANLKLEPGDKLDYGVRGMKWGQRKSEVHQARLERVASGTASRSDKVAIGRKVTTVGAIRSKGNLQRAAQMQLDRNKAKADKQKAKEALRSPAPKTPSGPESSADRYTRLLSQARQKGGNSLNDEELRFVTQRGDAIARVNRLNERKPGWAAEAAKQVLKSAAKKQMKSVAEGLSQKYIGDQLLNSKSE